MKTGRYAGQINLLPGRRNLLAGGAQHKFPRLVFREKTTEISLVEWLSLKDELSSLLLLIREE